MLRDVGAGLGVRRHAAVAADRARAGVVRGEHVRSRVAGHGATELQDEAVVLRRGRDRVPRVPHARPAVAVAVDAVRGPRAGHELGDAVGPTPEDAFGFHPDSASSCAASTDGDSCGHWSATASRTSWRYRRGTAPGFSPSSPPAAAALRRASSSMRARRASSAESIASMSWAARSDVVAYAGGHRRRQVGDGHRPRQRVDRGHRVAAGDDVHGGPRPDRPRGESGDVRAPSRGRCRGLRVGAGRAGGGQPTAAAAARAAATLRIPGRRTRWTVAAGAGPATTPAPRWRRCPSPGRPGRRCRCGTAGCRAGPRPHRRRSVTDLTSLFASDSRGAQRMMSLLQDPAVGQITVRPPRPGHVRRPAGGPSGSTGVRAPPAQYIAWLNR